MRRRDAHFVEELQAQIGEAGGVVTDAGKIAAVNAAYHYAPQATAWPAHLALKKAAMILRKPDVVVALRDCYVGAAGFSIVEALQLHVAHIRGSAPGSEGKANYQALKDYFGMALPAQAKRVESKNLNLTVSAPPPREGAPEMRARMVGPTPRMRALEPAPPDPED